MAKKTANTASARPNTPGDAQAAPAKAKATKKAVAVDAEVSAKARVKNAEATKRGPGRPRKETPGNLYEVTYQGAGKSAEAPQTKIVRAPDTSTAICAANKLNDLHNTHHFVIRATLINEQGVPLDTTYAGEGADEARLDSAEDLQMAAELLGEKPETTIDPIQAQNLPRLSGRRRGGFRAVKGGRRGDRLGNNSGEL